MVDYSNPAGESPDEGLSQGVRKRRPLSAGRCVPTSCRRLGGLEHRLLFAARAWDGGGAVDASWTGAAHWVDDVAPVAGDYLLFPVGAGRTANANAFAPGTAFTSVTFSHA